MDFENAYLNLLGVHPFDVNTIMKSQHTLRPIIINEITEDMPYLYFEALFFVSAKYPYNYRYKIGDNQPYCLFYTVNGHGLLTADNGEIHAEPSSLCFLPAKELESVKILSSCWDYYFMILNGREVNWFYQKFASIFTQSTAFPASAKLQEMLQSIETTHVIYQASMLKQLCYLTAFLTEAVNVHNASRDTEIPKYLSDIKKELTENFSQLYSLDILEKKYQVNKYKIVKDFTHFLGISPMNYLTLQRMEKAKFILSTSNLKINEVGRIVGYDNTTHFINSFKKQTGLTPLNYRKTNSDIF